MTYEPGFTLSLLTYPKGIPHCCLPEFLPTLCLCPGCILAECVDFQGYVHVLVQVLASPGLPCTPLLLGLSQHHTLYLQMSGFLVRESLMSCHAGSSVIKWWMVDGLCSALKMTTVPILLAPAVSSLRSSKFQFFQCVKAHFCLRDFAVSIPFVQNVLTLGPHMTGAFSLPRTQPKYCSPKKPSLGMTLKALLSFPISLSNCPVLLTSKHWPLSEIVLFIDVWLVHFLSPLEGQEPSCQAHCFIYRIWHVVSSHSTIVEWRNPKTCPIANILGRPHLSWSNFSQCFFLSELSLQFFILIPNSDSPNSQRHTFVER